MTTAVISRTSSGQYKGFVCMGHAGYAKNSEPDILCAAISVLITNTINSLEELAGEKFTYVTNEETGFIKCDFTDTLQEKSIFLLDSMVYGLKTLSRSYGKKYLQVKIEEV